MDKKTLIKTVSAATLVLGLSIAGYTAFAHDGVNHSATSTGATSTNSTSTMPGGYDVMVMKHLCNSNIKNIDDFRALEAGKDPVAALANTVLNCPTTGLPGTMAASGTVASPRMTYDFKISGEHFADMWLSKEGQYMQHKLSEADINKDVNGDGMISSSTALDISHYEFPNVRADNGRVEVTESQPPAGFRFGALRFTPPELSANNDKASLLGIDEAQGRIQLDMTNDTDKKIMLHVYNFRTGTGSMDNGNSGGNGGGNMNGGTGTSTDRAAIVNQINSLEQQIHAILAQIQALLAQLK